MTKREMERRIVDLEAECQRWREMAERCSKLALDRVGLPQVQLIPLVEPPQAFPCPLPCPPVSPFPWPEVIVGGLG